jgi:hypothetical protein
MKQIAVRLSPASLAQLAELVEWRGETQSLVMRVALDRLHTDEARKGSKETKHGTLGSGIQKRLHRDIKAGPSVG